jgi:1-acyl-sn-glycerol-3-phosphate acyltransferase
MVIAPEGTRKRVAQWRMGFYHTAVAAGVPITFGYLDYEKKEAGVGGVLYPSGDMAADMRYIADFYKNIKGKFPQNFQLDERF